MNCNRISWLAAIPTSLVVAGLAFGQVPTPTNQPPTQAPPAQMPPSPPPPVHTPPTQLPQPNQAEPVPSMRHVDRPAFRSLAGSKGYVTRNEARQDRWLSNHFSQCDTNHDGRISQSEYQQCHR